MNKLQTNLSERARCYPRETLLICARCSRYRQGDPSDSESRQVTIIDASTLPSFGPGCVMHNPRELNA